MTLCYKMRQTLFQNGAAILLQNATKVYMRHLVLLQNATVLLQNVAVITKCVDFIKNAIKVLKYAMFVTKCVESIRHVQQNIKMFYISVNALYTLLLVN